MSQHILEDDGSMVCRNAKGQLHCETGPAVIWPDGTKEYYRNNELCRPEGGPVVEYPNGHTLVRGKSKGLHLLDADGVELHEQDPAEFEAKGV